jgi:hypothetical protein
MTRDTPLHHGPQSVHSVLSESISLSRRVLHTDCSYSVESRDTLSSVETSPVTVKFTRKLHKKKFEIYLLTSTFIRLIDSRAEQIPRALSPFELLPRNELVLLVSFTGFYVIVYPS